MIRRVTDHVQVKALRAGAKAKASLIRAIQSVAIDAKRDDLPLARMKRG